MQLACQSSAIIDHCFDSSALIKVKADQYVMLLFFYSALNTMFAFVFWLKKCKKYFQIAD